MSLDPRPALDPAELPGLWLNADPEPRCIVSLATSLDGDRVRARLLGGARDQPAIWPGTMSGRLFTEGPRSPRIAGFLADCDLGFARVRLQVQLKLGVAVTGSFCSLAPRGGAAARGFVREFLGRLPASARSVAPDPDRASWPILRRSSQLEAALAQSDTPLDRVTGKWTNTASPPSRLAEVEIRRAGDTAATLHVRERNGATVHDWGARRAEAYPSVEEDGVQSVCLWASYDRPGSTVELQIRQNKGILAVTYFVHHREDDPRFDFVTRELFYRDGDRHG